MRFKQHTAWLILSSFSATVGICLSPAWGQTRQGFSIAQPPSSQGAVQLPASQSAGAVFPVNAGTIDIRTAGSFKALLAALEASGLTVTLAKPGAFTFFAPTDRAFAALPEGTLEELLQPANKAMLLKILSYHLVPGKMASTALKAGAMKTWEGNSMAVQVEPGKGIKVNNAQVILPNVPATNGVIHVIDKVILPPDILSQPKVR